MRCYTFEDDELTPSIAVDKYAGETGIMLGDEGGRFRFAPLCRVYPPPVRHDEIAACQPADMGGDGYSYHVYRESTDETSKSVIVLIAGADKSPYAHGPGLALSWGYGEDYIDQIWRLDEGQRVSFFLHKERRTLANKNGSAVIEVSR